MEIITGKYTEAKVYRSGELESYARAQLQMLCDNECLAGSRIRVMPDVHPGKVGTIGLTMTVGERLMPFLTGIDIGCGVTMACICKGKREWDRLDSVIKSGVPAGFSSQHKPHAKAADFDFSRLYCAKHIRSQRAALALGTLGSGNHFIEVGTEEWRFVLAHEYLHAGLMHHQRCAGRDRYLWNVACDFCVNSWLVEMGIGQMPPDGLLYDKSLQGLSAESIYDIIIREMRKYRKMGTFRGYGKGDIMSHPLPQFGRLREAVSLDEFFKNSLREGLDFHMGSSRGYLPAGLVEEIRSLTTPPIPWEVELAQWFDSRFPPLEKHRSYARPSRRQAATPHIPRPSYTLREEELKSRTFGVVVDTSGSVSARLLGLSLGAIASYAAAKDVGRVRVVFCDAEAYDAGYMTPEDLAGRVKVTGRGGTVLQPAVDLLEAARDFPPKGTILLITDGEIEDRLHVRREHAFLLPKGNRLPFAAKGKVFYFGDR